SVRSARLVAKSAPLCKQLAKLAEIIEKEISDRGAISFARFMELALYCPDYGFYEKERDNIGTRGDYYTSVTVGPLFGELLAFQFAEWFERPGDDNGIGAHESPSCELPGRIERHPIARNTLSERARGGLVR